MSRRPQIILASTRNELKVINEDLHHKCNSSYRLDLSQYRYRNPEAAVYDEVSNEYDIVLCLYHRNKCVSSVTGRYNKDMSSMELLSKTASEYEGLKFNLYLRTIFIYLMCFVRPTIKTIFSHSMNPISTYAMYKHYHATNGDLLDYVRENNLSPETFTPKDASEFHAYFKEKHKQTEETARKLYEEVLNDYDNDMDEIQGLFGWSNENEAIEFIMLNENVNAITLSLDLETAGIKEFLLNKLLSTQIKCDNAAVVIQSMVKHPMKMRNRPKSKSQIRKNKSKSRTTARKESKAK
jgi:hypothetical protein